MSHYLKKFRLYKKKFHIRIANYYITLISSNTKISQIQLLRFEHKIVTSKKNNLFI